MSGQELPQSENGSFGRLPTSPGEHTTVLIHYYRGEIARMSSWRSRIDQTSNWSITVVAAMLSVSLSTPTAHHGVLVFAMLLITLLLTIEARRYRFFDVYRDRIRLLERYYFGALFNGTGDASGHWRQQLGESLVMPAFKISFAGAVSRRLRRNYGWMFLILLLAWLLKISSALLQPAGAATDAHGPNVDLLASAQLGPVSGWVIIGAVAVFYCAIASLLVHPAGHAVPHDGKVHV